MEKENIVWHYTKMEVLKKIFLPEGNIRLRFTDCRFTNDPSECLILGDFLKKNEKRIIPNLDDGCKEIFKKEIGNERANSSSYIFSASNLEDSFAFWSKEYAGLDGISIGFNKEKVNKDKYFLERFINVEYINPKTKENDIDIIKIFSDHLNKMFKAYVNYKDIQEKTKFLPFFLDLFSFLYKHKSWEYEKESRLIISNPNPPTIEFTKNSIAECQYEKFDKNIVEYIILGPKCGDEQVEVVRKYLKKYGYEHIDVSRSEILDLRYKSRQS